MSSHTTHEVEYATVRVVEAGADQIYIAADVPEEPADADAACRAIYQAIAETLGRRGAEVVHERVFGSMEACAPVSDARAAALKDCEVDPATPVSYIQGTPPWGTGLAGVLLHAVRSPDGARPPWTCFHEGAPCGRAWERNGATFLLLQGFHGLPKQPSGDRPSREAQALQMFDHAGGALQSNGASYRDVVRTWIYLPEILEWYGDFNRVRNEKYDSLGLMPDLDAAAGPNEVALPASTGIQGANIAGAACIMDLLAVGGADGERVQTSLMTNEKQLDAFRYGAAFSRAACVREPDVTRVFVSGTAAIDEEGKSLYPGDAKRQIRRTLENVAALVDEAGGALSDLCDACLFLKRAEDVSAYRDVADELGLGNMPAVCMVADVCRAELLFEIDGVAVIPADRS